ncbi:hypothetical protein LX95_01276 [Mesonia algae]|uniref:Uncharacterized protein n=1 Tax=Mesonia algae TaxID=213248 RepID=A0A2W7I951_9FLAO|nr:hypothetical protein [Mesonia algae]PZW41595.1 hypothetical protein LX95_01276 [Mesonia algae]
MISPKENAELSKILGKNYTSGVISILNDKGITNKIGNSYSPSSVRQVFNGITENIDIELAIFELRDQLKAKQIRLEKLRAIANA